MHCKSVIGSDKLNEYIIKVRQLIFIIYVVLEAYVFTWLDYYDNKVDYANSDNYRKKE